MHTSRARGDARINIRACHNQSELEPESKSESRTWPQPRQTYRLRQTHSSGGGPVASRVCMVPLRVSPIGHHADAAATKSMCCPIGMREVPCSWQRATSCTEPSHSPCVDPLCRPSAPTPNPCAVHLRHLPAHHHGMSPGCAETARINEGSASFHSLWGILCACLLHAWCVFARAAGSWCVVQRSELGMIIVRCLHPWLLHVHRARCDVYEFVLTRCYGSCCTSWRSYVFGDIVFCHSV